MPSVIAIALAVTLVVEVPIVVAFYPRARLRMGVACAVATTATNLALNAVLTHDLVAYGPALVTGESLALLLEAATYAVVAPRTQSREAVWPRALAASAAANLSSFAAGLFLFSSGILSPS